MDNLAIIAAMVRDAEKHADDMAPDRVRSYEYYRGIMSDVPSDEGRSRMTTRDLRAQIKKVYPSLYRTIMGGEAVAVYAPVRQEDEAAVDQVNDYINQIIVPEANVHEAIEDGILDALIVRNGILRWWWESKREVCVDKYTGLDDMQFQMLVTDPDVEVLEHTPRQENVEVSMGIYAPQAFHDVVTRRYKMVEGVRTSAVPRERFLIDPEAQAIRDARIVGERMELTRSDLVAMGYDREVIDNLPIGEDDIEDEDDVRRDFFEESDDVHKPNQRVDYYDLFVRIDMDGDGIAELHHMCFAGGLAAGNLLMDEYADHVQYCEVKTMRQPHQWEGISLADDLIDIQQGKTVLLRQTLDNLYWQNNPQPIIQDGAIKNPDAVFNPEFGKPINVKSGVPVRDALGTHTVPMVADKSFAMMGYLDQEAIDRTGISDASGGLPPDAIGNMTAKQSAMMEQQGIAQPELMARTIGKCLVPFFRGILRLIIKHQDKPRTVRLRNQWVPIDPRSWNTELDVEVDTGLGAGSRERDMQAMSAVINMQERIVARLGPQNPFVKPDNLYAALSKFCEAIGIRNPSKFFSEPDPREIAMLQQQAASQPSPEKIKAQAQMQLKQMDVQGRMQMKQAELQAKSAAEAAQLAKQERVELAQRDADLAVEASKAEFEAQLEAQRMAFEAREADKDRQIELLRLDLERERMQQDQRMAGLKAAAEAAAPMLDQYARDMSNG